MKISFYLRYYTVMGEELYVTGNNKYLGDNMPENAVQMRWVDNDSWMVTIDLPDDFDDEIHYKYILKDLKGVYIVDGEEDRFINLSIKKKNIKPPSRTYAISNFCIAKKATKIAHITG